MKGGKQINMSKSIKINTLFNIIKTCSSIIFPLITFPYANRILLPDNIGKVNFAMSFVSYFALLASLGVQTYAIRECASVKNDKRQLSNVSSQIFSINLCMTIISYLLLFITIVTSEKIENYRVLIIIQSTTIIFTTFGADWLNSALEDFKYIAIRTIIFQFFSLIAIFVFVRSSDDYIKYAIINVVSSSGANILNYFYRKKYCNVKFTFHIEWKRHMIPISLLFAMTLSQTIFHNADITMLGLIWNDYQVGLYSTAHKITNLVSSLVQSVILVVMPRLSYFFANNDWDNANRLLRKLLLFNIGLGLPCVTGVIMLAKDIVLIVGGSEFASATPIMQVLILAFMFSLVGGSFLGNAILIPTKNEKYYMIVCWITAIANVIINALLIPKLAAVGAAIATAFNGFIILVLLLLKVDKRLKIHNKLNVFLGPIIGCLAIVICCFTTSIIDIFIIRLICSIISSIIVYIVVLYLCKSDFLFEIISLLKIKRKKSI